MVECLTPDRGFKPHRRHCLVFLSKNINPSLVLVQPRKTCSFRTEKLLMGGKNQIKQKEKKGTTGLPRSGKKIQVREKSGIFIFSWEFRIKIEI